MEDFRKIHLSIEGGALVEMESVRYFGVDVWSKNLFVPMYGDTSMVGRAISFGVRLVVLSVRSLGVVVWLFIAILLTILYVLIIPIALIGLFVNLGGLLS